MSTEMLFTILFVLIVLLCSLVICLIDSYYDSLSYMRNMKSSMKSIDLIGHIVVLENIYFRKEDLSYDNVKIKTYIITETIDIKGVEYLQCFSNEHETIYVPKTHIDTNENVINIKNKKIKYFSTSTKSFICFCDVGSKCVSCKPRNEYDALITLWG